MEYRTYEEGRSSEIQCVITNSKIYLTNIDILVELKKDPGIPRLPDLKAKKDVEQRKAAQVRSAIHLA